MLKSSNKSITAGLFCALFLCLTILLLLVQVQPVGPNGSSVGFAGLNSGFFKLVGEHKSFYTLSKLLGYLAILTVPFFAFLGLLQCIKGKSLAAVDRDILLLGIYYAVIAILYLLFDKLIVINYRPVLEDGELASSYPSTHALLAVTLFGAAALQFGARLNDKKLRRIAVICCRVFMGLTVIFRLLSGQHWLTDIIGGVLLGFALLYAYDALRDQVLHSEQSSSGE